MTWLKVFDGDYYGTHIGATDGLSFDALHHMMTVHILIDVFNSLQTTLFCLGCRCECQSHFLLHFLPACDVVGHRVCAREVVEV